MQTSEEARAWVVLTRTPGLNVESLTSALALLGSAHALVQASDASRRRVGLSAKACESLSSRQASIRVRECAWLDSESHHVLPFNDVRFPALLRTAARTPTALYVAGNVDALDDPQLAVVGSRNPTPQGLETAYAWCETLAGRGLGITSGLAQGIDSAAHRGALAAQGTTIAVLGTGVDTVYPRNNAPLAAQIALQGALISEFPPGTPPRRENFPQRNRIIACMSLGTLVVEAARRSGSLITGRLAAGQGRALFAVPGSIHNPLSGGCHALIREGAYLTETADDILNGLNFSGFFARHVDAATGPAAAAAGVPGMDKDHKILLDALGFDTADLDKLVVRTGFKPETVSSMMLILELEGHVQAAPGGCYSRVVRSRR